MIKIILKFKVEGEVMKKTKEVVKYKTVSLAEPLMMDIYKHNGYIFKIAHCPPLLFLDNSCLISGI